MKVRMLQTKQGSPDGIQVFEYLASRKYELPESLASVFLREGWAEEDKELVIEVKDETKTNHAANSRTDKSRRGKKPSKS